MGFLAALVGAIVDSIINPQNAGDPTEALGLAIAKLKDAIKTIAASLDASFQAAGDGFTDQQPLAQQAADAIRAVASNVDAAFSHTYDVAIPAALDGVIDYLTTNIGAPLGELASDLSARLDALTKRVEALEDWRTGVVKPALDVLADFLQYYNAAPRGWVEQLGDWIAHPDKLSAVLVSSLTPDAVELLTRTVPNGLLDELVAASITDAEQYGIQLYHLAGGVLDARYS